MNAVMAFERDQGRDPREMDVEQPNHPGYDIESTNEEGHLVRVIEVKSLGGDWGSSPNSFPRLTPPQFVEAQGQGERFWLYVVENAEADEPTITRIRNPARTATRFVFDAGWKDLGE